MSKIKVLAFDMDGVVLDHSPTIVSLMAARGQIIKQADTSFAKLTQLMEENTMSELLDSMYQQADGTQLSVLMEGAAEGINELRRQGYKIYLLSRRSALGIAKDTLRRMQLWPTIFNKNNSFFMSHSSEKITIARRLGVTHYVDDQPTALLGSMSPIPHKYLYDQFHCLPQSDAYTRVTSWEELVRVLSRNRTGTVRSMVDFS